MSCKQRTVKLVIALLCFCTTALPVSAQQAKGRGAARSVLMKIRARAGDTLASLAVRYNFPSELLQRLNGRNPDELLPAGLEVYLPSKSNLQAPALPASFSAASSAVPREFPVDWSKEDRYRFLRPYIVSAAQRNGIDVYLLTTVCDIETTFKPNLTSPVGAMGLTQLMPGTAARFGVSDAYDLKQALDGGAKYLRYLTEKFDGDLDLILAGYNSGEGNVIKYGRRVPPFNETQGYVARGRTAYLRYSQAQSNNLSQLASNVRLTSFTPTQPERAESDAPGGEDEQLAEPLPVTRSLVYGEESSVSTGNEKENNQSSPGAPRVTRSIRFQ